MSVIPEDKEIRNVLLKQMKEGMFADADRLPRETVLAEKLGISRTQLRDALSDLEREGFITRRHGVGTIINRHVLEVANRMDIETEFLDIIRQNGLEASVSFLRVSEGVADAKAAGKLNIAQGTPVICIHLICNAGSRPVIYSEDVLDKRLIKEDYKSKEHNLIVFEFLKKFCDKEVYMDLTELHAVAADEKISEILQIPKESAVLNLEEVDYDIEGHPIFCSSQYFLEGYFRHTILRKKF